MELGNRNRIPVANPNNKKTALRIVVTEWRWLQASGSWEYRQPGRHRQQLVAAFRCRIRKLSVFFCLALWFTMTDAVLCERVSFTYHDQRYPDIHIHTKVYIYIYTDVARFGIMPPSRGRILSGYSVQQYGNSCPYRNFSIYFRLSMLPSHTQLQC